MVFEKVQMRKTYSSYGISHHIPFMVTKLSYFMIPQLGTVVGSLWYFCRESLCHIPK